MDYNLNEQQLKAVKIVSGPSLILAGAGSGKTRVLTSKIAYLISECGISPDSILAITFTNKAAKEMKERVVNYLGPIAYNIQISTFHSFGLLIIKQNCKELGYDENFTILDADDSLTVIRKIMKDLNIDQHDYNPKAIKNAISSAKNELIDSYGYEKFSNSDFTSKVYEVYKKYETKLKLSNSLDFDDLLLLPIKLFRQNPSVLEKYQDKYQYVLIDEYQDTNEAQYIFSKMLCNNHKNAEVVLLEENYRSTKTILEAANNVIKNNTERKDKNLWTDNEEGDKIHYYRAIDEKDEARYVLKNIKTLLDNGVDYKDIAVLYRTNAQSRNVEDLLLEDNIPYKVVGSFYFYNRKEIKDLIAYLKVIYNPSDDTNLLRIINVPKRGIGLKSIEKLTNEASLNNSSIYNIINEGKELKFKELIDYFIKVKDNLSLTELVDEILDKSGIKHELESEKDIEAEVRLENLNEFKSITKSFEESIGIVSLEGFLNEISLVSDVAEYKNNPNTITLMTVHSAKGLEFDNVFLIGMEEGLFPHSNSFIESNGIEEERRLCYVAITRAKKNLWIVNAKRRTIYGMDSVNKPSRFIGEIPDECLDKENVVEISDKEFTMPIDLNTNVDYNVGDKVVHDTFGEGIIVSIDKSIVTIAFPHPHGIKKIMKGHKSIRKVK